VPADIATVEAASIAWRPLGRLLVEKGLLTNEELELALAKQQLTGKRLGETIVECGFVSRPELSEALAAQYGIELKTETGFGTGLRAQIQQRHESDRGRVVRIGLATPVEQPETVVSDEPDVEPVSAESQQSAELLAQLEEQWAKLAAAEEQLAEREAVLAAAVVERDGRRAQAERLARRARTARADQADHRERRRALILRFVQRVRERDEEIQRLTAALEGRAEAERSAGEAETKYGELQRSFAAVAADRDRRRAQAVRFLARARRRDDDLARSLAERDRKRAQAGRFLRRLRRREPELNRLREALDAHVDDHRAALAAAEEHRVGLERALAELATDWDRRHAQAVRFARRARGLAEVVEALRDDLERLNADVRGCDAEIERLRQENARRRTQAARFAVRLRARPSDVEQESPVPVGHLVFVHGADGYSLVEREGPPPRRDTALELPDLDGAAFVVSALRRSPLPGDRRPCVVAERV